MYTRITCIPDVSQRYDELILHYKYYYDMRHIFAIHLVYNKLGIHTYERVYSRRDTLILNGHTEYVVLTLKDKCKKNKKKILRETKKVLVFQYRRNSNEQYSVKLKKKKKAAQHGTINS